MICTAFTTLSEVACVLSIIAGISAASSALVHVLYMLLYMVLSILYILFCMLRYILLYMLLRIVPASECAHCQPAPISLHVYCKQCDASWLVVSGQQSLVYRPVL